MEIIQIDKKVLLAFLKDCKEEVENSCDYTAGNLFNNISLVLDDIPTIQSEVHAEWRDSYRSGYKPPDVVVCSHCNNWSEVKTKYCENCGAQMNMED